MAHVQKMKQAAIAPMLRHYRREMPATLERDNIEPEKTPGNYTVGRDEVESTIKACVDAHNAHGRALRADAVLMADWVITLPENVPESRTEEFFRECHRFLQNRYGSLNVPCGFVHMDETTPHMHAPVIPFDRDTQRFQASKMVNRADLNTFHDDLSEHIEKAMGTRFAVKLDREVKQEKAVKYGSLDEYKDRQDALKELNREIAETTERLERVRRLEEEAHGTPFSDLADARRERELAEENQRLRARAAELAEGNGKLREAIEQAKRRIVAIGKRIAELPGEIRGTRDAIETRLGRIRELEAKIEPLREARRSRSKVPGPSSSRRPTPQGDYDYARRASQAMSQGRSYGRGRAR